MQVKIFIVPVFDADSATYDLNRFLRSQRILEVQQELVTTKHGACWCFCVKYVRGGDYAGKFGGRKEKVDYKQVLSKEEFEKFEKLRACRKQIAKNDAVPAYAVFIDAELAEMAKLEAITEERIRAIEGIGEKRVEKYGKLLVNMYNKERGYEKNGESAT